MKLGHISDLHIFALEQTTPKRFLNKRLVGGTNILFNRGKSHSPQVVQAALDMLDSFGVDHIAITGDLTNLALEEEFRAAANVIDGITDAESRVSVVPGNHDYYVPEIEQTGAFERHFERFQQSDLPSYQLETGYPFCKFFGEDVALIGLNTGIASPPMFAVGKVDEKELRSLEQLLDDPKVRDRYKIVMLHHPLLPFEHSKVEYTRRLVNAHEVLEVLRWKNVNLAIHGHNHYYHKLELPHLGAPGTLHICEAGSTSVSSSKNPMSGGKFNVYTIEDGRLLKIETYLFESDGAGFTPWRELHFDQE